MSRILVAMSGGVDSSVAAALLHEQGHEVVGVWMRLHDVADSYSEFKKSCCSLGRRRRRPPGRGPARDPVLRHEPRARVRGGRHRAVRRGYLDGRTPSPCIDCNTYVKFGALLGRARHLYECEAVATGHYARRVVVDAGRPREPASRAPRRRQGPDVLPVRPAPGPAGHSRFPLGELTKPEVRAIARGLGLATADKPESQEICFVPGGDYREALRDARRLDARGRAGRRRRRRAGGGARRRGGFTVGQRQGLGVALGEPRYVSAASIRVEHDRARPARGPRDDARSRSSGVTFVADEPPPAATRCAAPFRAQVRIRHRATLVDATVRPAAPGEPARGGRWTVETDTPVWAIAPGQACVLYDGDACLGGGRIARPARARPPPVAAGRVAEPVPHDDPARAAARAAARACSTRRSTCSSAAMRGGRLPLTYIAASLGAWAGAALGNRLGLDLIAIGDFPLIPASIMAWVGIGIVAILATLGPQRAKA